jgi:hypothetical protein
MTASRRQSLPRTAFGLEGSRRFPLDTPGRAINAKARATQMEQQGKLSPSSARKIRGEGQPQAREAAIVALPVVEGDRMPPASVGV